ncbi:PREDICTED: omega-conotoxin-like protein 1 [Atta cephalotes]|uniref:Omega-conotoxin-like protein 1 n=1 Tax=Atta cephalotes TaxID=12957 RepID=A0A158NP50_ATTCE|nr:PREDICTED: omega-conotoxin-like protein 1 [Atta cephalotes]XP_018055666.1 PREDICTED: omega-conotoxin-like protein 1 [Atta colombica]
MAKLMLYVFVALLAASLIMGAPDKSNCGRHGDPCYSDSQCCSNIKCHRYANRCQVQITEAELMAQREKILGRRGKDY